MSLASLAREGTSEDFVLEGAGLPLGGTWGRAKDNRDRGSKSQWGLQKPPRWTLRLYR